MIHGIEKETIVNLIKTYNKVTDTVAETLKEFDLTLPQFNILRILRGQKGAPVTLATIHQQMISRMSNTTRLVDKLLTKQLVNRQICPHNRRKVDITITALGLDLLAKIDPIIYKTDQKLMSDLSHEEMIQLNELLNKIRQ
ncbi:MarR family winged helix-turn-helix transcriptional regulator [Aquimarina rhabdastrellae]